MRSGLVIAIALAACSRSPQTSHTRFVTIGSDAVATALAVSAQDGQLAQVFAATDDAAILAVEEHELEALSHAMHEAHGRCGGFMLHDTRIDAELALLPPDAQAAPDYTLSRPEVVAELLPQIDPKRIQGTIAELSAMKNRYYRSESGAAASAWLAKKWASYTERSDVTIEFFDQGYPQKSVIMTIPGLTDEVVVIGGHLDSIALGGLSSNAPGADDDASGIATLTEVARVVLANDLRPVRTLKFIAYAAEEIGLRGSLAIVKEFKKRGVNVVGVLQLDMTNFQGSDRDIWIIDDHTSHAQNAFLVKLIETYLPDTTWGSDKCGYACSDHAAWHAAGIPASMPFESRSRDMNKHIHSAKDTLEQSGHNANHAAKFARLATAYATELARLDHTPPLVCGHSLPRDTRRGADTSILTILGLVGLLGIGWILTSRLTPALTRRP